MKEIARKFLKLGGVAIFLAFVTLGMLVTAIWFALDNWS